MTTLLPTRAWYVSPAYPPSTTVTAELDYIPSLTPFRFSFVAALWTAA
jgi:hypothetical protein